MKKLLRPLLFLCIIIAGLSSCKNEVPKEAKYIPKDASFVMVLDPQQMQDKLQKGGISMDTLIGKIFKSDSADIKDKKKFEELRTNAGINWGNKLFVFMLNKTNTDNSISNTFSLIGGISDSAKFTAFLKKQEELKDKEIKKEKDYSYINIDDGGMLAWNDQLIIATRYSHTQKPGYDSVTMSFKQPEPANVAEETKSQVTRYFTQKVNESLADQKMFTSMFKEKADGYLFTSANSSLATLSALPFQIPKLEELVKDNYSTSTLSFDDGKISVKSTTYPSPLLANVFKQYSGPTVNLSLLENYPSKNINGVMMFAFNPEIFGGILKQLEIEGLANNFMEKTGIGTQDLYHALKGDICVVVSDLDFSGKKEPEPELKHDERSMMGKKSIGKMILNAPVGDKTSFFKLMDKALEQGFLVKNNNMYKSGGLLASLGIYIAADDKNLIIASDSLTYAAYMAKTEKAVMNKDVMDMFKNKSAVFYFDIANTINGFGNNPSGNYNHSLATAKNTFKDVIGTSANFDGKSIKASFDVRMQNEKQNSLVTLTSLLTDIAVDMRVTAKKERESEEKLFLGGVPAIIRTN